MWKITFLVTLVACKSEPSSSKAPLAAEPTPPKKSETAVTPTPTVPPSAPTASAVPLRPAQVGPVPTDPTLITRLSFGMFQDGEKVTPDLLKAKFGKEFVEQDDSNTESGEERLVWADKDGVTANDGQLSLWLSVEKGGMSFRTFKSDFHAANGIRSGMRASKLIEKTPDLKCIEIEDEENRFDCWSKSLPELHYVGIGMGVIKRLAKTDHTIDYLEWRPASTNKCGDGKITYSNSATGKTEDVYTVFCSANGTPMIESAAKHQGNKEETKKLALDMKRWAELWTLTEATGWRTATTACGSKPDERVDELSIANAGVVKKIVCFDHELSPAVQALTTAMIDYAPTVVH